MQNTEYIEALTRNPDPVYAYGLLMIEWERAHKAVPWSTGNGVEWLREQPEYQHLQAVMAATRKVEDRLRADLKRVNDIRDILGRESV